MGITCGPKVASENRRMCWCLCARVQLPRHVANFKVNGYEHVSLGPTMIGIKNQKSFSPTFRDIYVCRSFPFFIKRLKQFSPIRFVNCSKDWPDFENPPFTLWRAARRRRQQRKCPPTVAIRSQQNNVIRFHESARKLLRPIILSGALILLCFSAPAPVEMCTWRTNGGKEITEKRLIFIRH